MSAPVLHGRRKGQVKEVGVMPGSAGFHPDVRQMTVLRREDWDRIQFQLNKRAIEEDRMKVAREEKDRLVQLSKDRAKHWSNTFAGQRQRKLEARKIREEKEEEEKKAVDIEEAKFQGEKRKEAIEKAKTQQYYQTDRVKGFHGALLLTEVLKERDAQVELKELKARAHSGNDRQWSIHAQQEYEKAILKDQMEAMERKQRVRDTALFQKAQINGHLREQDCVEEDARIEGDELKRLAAQYDLEKTRLGEIRNAEARQMMSDNLKQIGDVVKMRTILKDQEEEEDEECRIFAAAKRKMMKLRTQKEGQLHSEKQEKLEKIRGKLHAQIQQIQDDEDDRIKRAVEESEGRREREEKQKEEAMMRMQAEIRDHRHRVLVKKKKVPTATLR